MKTIKIIDLLNKIANGEEIPKKIKHAGAIFEYYERLEGVFNYREIVDGEYVDNYLNDSYFIENILNDEVEILEEEKKLPEKINVKGSYNSNKGYEDFNDNEKILVDKINEVLDYLESKEKGE